jgi:hypothetical protein
MRSRTFFTCVAVLFFVGFATAQTKVSGTVQCSRPDQQHSLNIGDYPGHSFVVSQGKCTWTKPMQIAGSESKEDTVTVFAEVRGNKVSAQGYGEGTLASGDKFTVRLRATQMLKDGKVQSEEGSWTLVDGTGKAKGIKGKGTYKGKPEGDNMVTEVEGEIELPK